MNCRQCIEEGEQCIGCMIIEYKGKKHFSQTSFNTQNTKRSHNE